MPPLASSGLMRGAASLSGTVPWCPQGTLDVRRTALRESQCNLSDPCSATPPDRAEPGRRRGTPAISRSRSRCSHSAPKRDMLPTGYWPARVSMSWCLARDMRRDGPMKGAATHVSGTRRTCHFLTLSRLIIVVWLPVVVTVEQRVPGSSQEASLASPLLRACVLDLPQTGPRLPLLLPFLVASFVAFFHGSFPLWERKRSSVAVVARFRRRT
ncbi:hypothetical protein CALCODRAFT_234445 [Calocera cornea HHB12733]|uniref:Uncharacterized protein n=1 Tax=Calocera cornea HHB12733 TaxID=1353952 RepID=A0A165GXL1_9BASI|nr:hypothetical protein CALCODRAFT_234445 [Calocera cornea HHB12733]